MRKILILGGIAIAGLIFLGASCSKSSSSQNQQTTTPVETNTVSIANFAFDPSSATVNKGTTVTWTNNDSTAHTVISDTSVFGSNKLQPGDKFQFTFNITGTFPYHCSIHTTMKGTVTVK